MKTLTATLTALVILALSATPGAARTKMVMLPDRDEVKIHLDNPNAIMVEEVRTVPLQKGKNHVDFSWKGVTVDKGSLQLAILSHPDKARLIAFSYPPSENAVVAEIYADEPLEEKIRVAYLLSGVAMETSYHAVADRDEKALEFKSYVKISNNSGEDFSEALVTVGYGTEYKKSLQHEEAKKMLAASNDSLPVRKKFLWDANVQPHDPENQAETVGIPVYYQIENKKDAGLGEHPLLDGKMRVFQKDSAGTTAFLGEDWGKFTAVGDSMEVYVGDSRDIVVKRKVMDSRDTNVRKNFSQERVLFDREEKIKYELENFKDKPLEISLRDYHQGYWEIPKTSHPYEKKDATTFEFHLRLEPKGKLTVEYTVVEKNIKP